MGFMPDAAVIAVKPGGDAKTAGAENSTDAVAQPAGTTGQTEPATGPRSDYLAGLIMPLRAIINAFPVELPEQLDGETWLCFDSAMAGLYGALAALEDIDRRRSATRESTDPPCITAGRSDPPPRCDHDDHSMASH